MKTFKVGDKVRRINYGNIHNNGVFRVGEMSIITKVNGNYVDTEACKENSIDNLELVKEKEESSSQAISNTIKSMLESGSVEALGGKLTFSTDEYEVTITKK